MKPGAAWAGVVLGLISLQAGALGLGDMELMSAPGQPLQAEILLEAATPEELRELRVGLAGAETSERGGPDRSADRDGLRFEVTRNRAGDDIVRVTSPDPVVTPVTILVEAVWPRGRVQREYTLLPDAPLSVPATEGGADPVQPDAVDFALAGNNGADTYGPVQSGDTLWGLAERFRPPGAITNQMMVALFEANPQAFTDDMNVLFQGVVLRIPDAAQALRLTEEEAIRETLLYGAEWESDAARQARLGLVPPAEEPVVDAAAGSAVEAGELAFENDALRSELEDARRLLELRDAEMQALQTQLREAQAAAQQATAEPASVQPPPAGATPEQPPPASAPLTPLSRLMSSGRPLLLIGLGTLAVLGIGAGFLLGRRTDTGEARGGKSERPERKAAGDKRPSTEPRTADSQTFMEVGTKLDLARAYLDMGDVDEARRVLQAVVKEGDPGQRQEAKALIEGL